MNKTSTGKKERKYIPGKANTELSDDADRLDVTGARAKGVVRKAAGRMVGVVMETVTSPLKGTALIASCLICC